ncbi:SemiSWEET transporter [Pollutibacter soli]|uniref:SemiSWEET family sugar transporter n=1 Tax=Pollutibacter soli TaxID=3034157 RepID=UPI003013D169
MNNYTQYVGIAAGIFTAISMLPQLIKIVRTKKAESVSLFMVIILLLGLSAWVLYGWLKKDWPIIVTNAFSIVVNVLIFIFSVRYKQKNGDGN